MSANNKIIIKSIENKNASKIIKKITTNENNELDDYINTHLNLTEHATIDSKINYLLNKINNMITFYTKVLRCSDNYYIVFKNNIMEEILRYVYANTIIFSGISDLCKKLNINENDLNNKIKNFLSDKYKIIYSFALLQKSLFNKNANIDRIIYRLNNKIYMPNIKLYNRSYGTFILANYHDDTYNETLKKYSYNCVCMYCKRPCFFDSNFIEYLKSVFDTNKYENIILFEASLYNWLTTNQSSQSYFKHEKKIYNDTIYDLLELRFEVHDHLRFNNILNIIEFINYNINYKIKNNDIYEYFKYTYKNNTTIIITPQKFNDIENLKKKNVNEVII